MNLELETISVDLILKACNEIEAKNLELSESVGYQVTINEKAYSPRELVKYVLRINTSYEQELGYSDAQINKHFNKLGFVVVTKISIWKLGCNWDRGNPSFYNFIKNEQIVFTVSKYSYQVGDLVLVTQGFTVFAIAKVIEPIKPVTIDQRFKKACQDYHIPFEDWILYSKVEWYELNKNDVFIYELQQGIRQVRKNSILEKAISLWDNKEVKSSSSKFYIKDHFNVIKSKNIFPCLVLEALKQVNDVGYVTSFALAYYKSLNEKTDIGIVKILQKGNSTTELPNEFVNLNSQYCSLGQTMEYYSRLSVEFPEQYRNILENLKDCAFFKNDINDFEKEPGFQSSIIKSSEALLVYHEAQWVIPFGLASNNLAFFNNTKTNTNIQHYNFTFSYRLEQASSEHIVDFTFDWDKDLKNNFFCLIGKNGTGKTKLLSQLALKLSDNNEVGEFIPNRPSFSKIIATSFSYFDNFNIPTPDNTNYEFIGVRYRKGIFSRNELTNVIWTAFKRLNLSIEKRKFWIECMKRTLETEYLSFSLEELDSLSTQNDFVHKTEEIFSSGQNIIFQLITRLISIIEINSLLIFDEPETHLHPNITGRLLRTLDYIMKCYNSHCILATHSPIIVQEIPSKFIRIIDRQGNFPLVYSPSIECFGENLSNISNSIFYASEDKELYKSTFDVLRETKSVSEIEDLFGNGLSLNARLYLQSMRRKK